MLVLIAHMRTPAGAGDISFLASGTGITVAVGDQPLSTKLGRCIAASALSYSNDSIGRTGCGCAANVGPSRGKKKI
jgi:hypothetical protein